eukprot:1194729-Pleurochrysis_carterae.AAC.1
MFARAYTDAHVPAYLCTPAHVDVHTWVRASEDGRVKAPTRAHKGANTLDTAARHTYVRTHQHACAHMHSLVLQREVGSTRTRDALGTLGCPRVAGSEMCTPGPAHKGAHAHARVRRG